MERAHHRHPPVVRFGRVHAHGVDLDEAIDRIVERAKSAQGGFVLTPNVDHIAMAQHSSTFVDAYRRAFLSLPDGMPLLMISRLLRLPLPAKVSGSDLFEPLLARCADEGLPVFFLGSTGESCERAILMLKERYPHIEITGYDDSFFDADLDAGDAMRAFHRARASGARVIICSLPPMKQVLLSQYMWEYAPAVGVATGGALAFFVGEVKRAPKWVSNSGFEWMYRLAMEPRRLWRRYLVQDVGALPVFIGMVLRRLTGRPLYEPAPADIVPLRQAARPRRTRDLAGAGPAVAANGKTPAPAATAVAAAG
jgi:N-acetylglucosaminyldiphosphoundecaprenol N-acetyl-beta-D-mannosaminyltransferase